MQERTDVGQNVQGQDDAEQEDTGQDGCRTGRMRDKADVQDRMDKHEDAEQEDAEQEDTGQEVAGHRAGWMQRRVWRTGE